MSLLLVLLLAAAPAPGQDPGAKPPVHITADKVSLHGKRNTVVWIGHVKAVRQTTTITCDRMIAHYDDHQQVTRLECLGHVHAYDGDKWALGDRGDFDNLSSILVVTGNPEGGEGHNRIKGTRVTFYAGKDEVDVDQASAIVDSTKLPAQGQAP